ncbi:MAG: hypothetical protein KBD50_01450 [Candidatus Pacebacteria bacterium]|nr:hypothetical protein [Candidatus Paceibacterota bacterium]
MRRITNNIGFLKDLGLLALSILIAIILVRTDALVSILTRTEELEFWGSFVAGLFFTSIFTTAPAIVTLGEIAQVYPIFLTALAGAAGAVVGDLIIFRFVKDRFSDHLMEVFGAQGGRKRLKHLLKIRSFRWLTFLLGGLIIASPLPDELGVALLGFSKMKVSGFIFISFIFNFIGILIIGIAARSFG